MMILNQDIFAISLLIRRNGVRVESLFSYFLIMNLKYVLWLFLTKTFVI